MLKVDISEVSLFFSFLFSQLCRRHSDITPRNILLKKNVIKKHVDIQCYFFALVVHPSQVEREAERAFTLFIIFSPHKLDDYFFSIILLPMRHVLFGLLKNL